MRIATIVLVVAGCSQNEKILNPAGVTVDTREARNIAQSFRDRTITNEQVMTIFQRPLDFHLAIGRELFLLDGRSATEADDLVRGLREEIFALEPTPPAGTFSAVGACDQWVEHKTVVRDPVWASSYSTFSDPVRGLEYVFYFWPGWSVDPNNIRWGASDPRVFWALYLRGFFGSGSTGQLWGFNLCSKPHKLLIGDKTIAAGGGVNWVGRNLYIHHL